MHRSTLSRLFASVLAAGILVGAGSAQAATNSTPLKIVIGFSPGGALDNMSRLLAEKLQQELDQSVIVENRPGAGTQIALQAVKRARPDGNTILISPLSPVVLFPLTYDSLPYDPDKDLLPVAHLVDVPLVVSTAASSPFSTMQEYVKWVKANPSQTGMGMVALGGLTHFGLLSMNQDLGLSLMPIAYKGAAGMLTDEIGGVLPIGIDAVASKSELERAEKIKYLAVTGTKRSKVVPDVPTLQESGVPGFEYVQAWYSAFVPAGTPKPVVDKLQAALIKIVLEPGFTAKMAEMGMVSTGMTSTELAALIQTQRAAFKPIVEKSGFRATQ